MKINTNEEIENKEVIMGGAKNVMKVADLKIMVFPMPSEK